MVRKLLTVALLAVLLSPLYLNDAVEAQRYHNHVEWKELKHGNGCTGRHRHFPNPFGYMIFQAEHSGCGFTYFAAFVSGRQIDYRYSLNPNPGQAYGRYTIAVWGWNTVYPNSFMVVSERGESLTNSDFGWYHPPGFYT